MDCIWVVEVKFEGKFKWETTVGVGITRDDGRVALNEWKRENPFDQFRLRCYIRQDFFKNTLTIAGR